MARGRPLLDESGVEPFFSPPITPEYNGACEAGIGALKTRAHHIAARHGRPAEWTCDDIEAARLLAHATSRPRGHNSPTPQTAWRHHTELDPGARPRFQQTVRAFYDEAPAEHRSEQARPSLRQPLPHAAPPATPFAPALSHDCAGPGPADAGPDPAPALCHYEYALLQRVAVRRALVAHGLLSFTGRRITPPIKPKKVARIT